MSTPSVNPISQRLPTFDLETPEGRIAAHRYVASGIVDLNQAIPQLKAQITALQKASSSSGGSSSSSSTTAGVTSFNAKTGAITFFPELGTDNDQTGNTTYTIQDTDNGGMLILNDAAAVAVSLNSNVTAPYFLTITNAGAGTATLTPTSGTVNGKSLFLLLTNNTVRVVFDGTNWQVSTNVITGVNVTSYGAKCDGVTDDTAAIQAALDANGVVEFPPAVTCVISGTLAINSQNIVLGNLATLRHSGSATAITVTAFAAFLTQFQLILNGSEPYGIDIGGGFFNTISTIGISGTGAGNASIGSSAIIGNTQVLSISADGALNFIGGGSVLYLQNIATTGAATLANFDDVTMVACRVGSGSGDAVTINACADVSILGLTPTSTNGIAIVPATGVVSVNATLNSAGGAATAFTGSAGGLISYNGQTWLNGILLTATLSGVSGSLGGSAMTAGQTISTTVTIVGAATGMVASVSPQTYPGDGFVWDAYVSAADTVTVRLTAVLAGTPTASIYSARVLQ